jgi:hypothetical protein
MDISELFKILGAYQQYEATGKATVATFWTFGAVRVPITVNFVRDPQGKLHPSMDISAVHVDL